MFHGLNKLAGEAKRVVQVRVRVSSNKSGLVHPTCCELHAMQSSMQLAVWLSALMQKPRTAGYCA